MTEATWIGSAMSSSPNLFAKSSALNPYVRAIQPEDPVTVDKDSAFDNADSLLPPDVIAQEIIEDLTAAPCPPASLSRNLTANQATGRG